MEKKNKILTRKQKEFNDHNWYKENIKRIRSYRSSPNSNYREIKRNYDLYNNIIDIEDFEYVCRPFGDLHKSMGVDYQAKIKNVNILSNKINVLMGIESNRGFDYSLIDTSPSASTRKEEKETELLRDYVINSIMEPIKKSIEIEKYKELNGQEITQQQIDEINKQVEQELQAKTPEQVKEYMQYDHKDPSEILGNDLLNYLKVKTDSDFKFNQGIKHAGLSANEFYYCGEINGQPDFININPLHSIYDVDSMNPFIEYGDYFGHMYYMTLSEVVSMFNDTLKKSEIDSLYSYENVGINDLENLFSYDNYNSDIGIENSSRIPVFHAVWRDIRKIRFLNYLDENGEIQTVIVDEEYQLNIENGDISIEDRYIPEVYEGYQIANDIYKNMRPVIGQFKDLDNLFDNPLPYMGAVYDSTNAKPISIFSRGVDFQYLYNIIMFRIELLMASDKGKKILMNINAIPKSANFDIVKWQYFFETTPYTYFNPSEEGTGYSDVNTIAKVIDMSTAQDIDKYINLSMLIKEECGEVMGISRQMEAQIHRNEEVGNTNRILAQNSKILEPFFNMHDRIKKNVLTRLIEVAKVVYRKNKPKKLSYILDDVGMQIINMNYELLDNSTYGLFLSNNSKVTEIKETLRQLMLAAMQNGQMKFSNLIALAKEDNLTRLEKIMQVSEKEIQENQNAIEEQKIQLQEKMIQDKENERKHEKDMIVLKEEERRKTELVKGTLIAASYNPDKDSDKDGINDFIELSKIDSSMITKNRELDIKEKELEFMKEDAKEKNEIKKKELKNKKNK